MRNLEALAPTLTYDGYYWWIIVAGIRLPAGSFKGQGWEGSLKIDGVLIGEAFAFHIYN